MDEETRITVSYKEGLPPQAVIEHLNGEDEAFIGWDRYDKFDAKYMVWNRQRLTATPEERRLDAILTLVTELTALDNLASPPK
jgi:hypothetical protein